MRYLKSREDFLTSVPNIENVNINEQIKSSKMITEAFENDIRWGDSLVGRLINSTIRLIKIGYNQTKIPKIVEALECELNRLLTEAMSRDMSAQYNYLYIRRILSEIQDICLSTQDDTAKLRLLLGWDGDDANPMWNGEDPEADLPGRVEGGRIVTDQHGGGTSIMQNIIDRVTENLPNLEKYIGVGREELLDALSNFTIELRKMTVEEGARGSGSAPLPNFSVNFANILNVLTSVNESKLIGYWGFMDMIFEKEERSKIQKIRDTIESLKKSNPNDPQIKNWEKKLQDLENKSRTTDQKTNTEEPTSKTGLVKSKSPTQNAEGGDKRENGGNQQNPQNPETGEVKNGDKNVGGSDSKTTDDERKQGESKGLAKLKEIAQRLKSEIGDKDENEIKKLKSFGELKSELLAIDEQSKKKIQSAKVKVDDKEMSLYSALCKFLDIELKESKNYVILEGTGGTTPPQGATPSGSAPAGSAPSGSSSNRGTSAYESVKDLFQYYWKEEIDKGQIKPLTQREVEQFETLLQEGRDQLVIDLTKRPDPVVAITRICTRAHRLYFQDVIPSGRKDGMVSNKTFREYIYIGEGSRPDPARLNGAGPFLIKSIWEEWVDGVTRLLENQELRKVLSNVKFVVAGAEDSFNMGATKESKSYKYNQLLLEAEKDEDIAKRNKVSEKAPHGEIIFNFINDLIDEENQANFSKSRKKLMKQYFGIVDPTKSDATNSRTREPKPEDREQSVFIWQSCTLIKFRQDDLYRFFAFPVDDNRDNLGQGNKKKEMIFMQPIKFIGEKVLVKFTFNTQVQANKFKKDFFNSYSIQDYSVSSQTTDTKYIYLGLLSNDKLSTGLKLVYANVTTMDPEGIYSKPKSVSPEYNFRIERGTIKNKSFPNGSKIHVSKLVRYDENKKYHDDVFRRDFIVFREKKDSDFDNFKPANQRFKDPQGNAMEIIQALENEGKNFGFWT